MNTYMIAALNRRHHRKSKQINLVPASVSNLPLLSLWEYELIMQEYIDRLPTTEDIFDCVRASRDNMDEDLPNTKMIMFGDTVVGMLVTELTDAGLYLRDIYIVDTFRNKGIGTNIIKKICNENSLVYLNVYRSNNMAIRLYERVGFKIVSDNGFVYKMQYGV